MRRHLSLSRSVENNEENNELILQNLLDESEQGLLNDTHVSIQRSPIEGRISRSDLSKLDAAVIIEPESSPSGIIRTVSVTSRTKALFSRKSCILLVVIAAVFLVLTSLLIHKILTSVHELDVPAETKVCLFCFKEKIIRLSIEPLDSSIQDDYTPTASPLSHMYFESTLLSQHLMTV